MATASRGPRTQLQPRKARRGVIALLAAFLMIIMVGMMAFAVDVGYMNLVHSELRRAADAGALAGAGDLVQGIAAAEAAATGYIHLNETGNRLYESADLEIEPGTWNRNSRSFSPTNSNPNALRVLVRRPDQRLFFGGIFNTNVFSTQAEAVATYQPRDIAVVLDYSASMNDDSELKAIPALGKPAVESNLAEIYDELGGPDYGTLQFEPEYLTLTGMPPTGPLLPQITVTFQSNSVHVTSTKDLSNVVLKMSNGATQKFDGLSGTSGTFAPTGSSAGLRIDKVWVKSGSNASGQGPGYGEPFEDTNAAIKSAFGLNDEPYPYPAGSWDDYINYVKKKSSNELPSAYRKRYGHMTLINYWLERYPMYSQNPDLWMTGEQPITALKDAMQVFLAILQEHQTNDQVALAVYTAEDGTALLESPLTKDYALIEDISRHRQAGHYDHYTNIGDGLRSGVDELIEHARPGAARLVVLMTDGIANRPTGTDPIAYALEQAQYAADARIPVVTISVGAGADLSLMQRIADLTGGVHFNVPGGQSVAEYELDLKETFRKVAEDRPVQLVR